MNESSVRGTRRRRAYAAGAAAIALASMVSVVGPVGAEGVGSMAAGAAHISRNGERLTLSFTVKQLASGEVVGQAQRYAEPTDTTTHYELNCLRIVGTKVIVGGIITRSTSPSVVVGRKAIFSVEDNGEGRNDPVDRVSFVLHATSDTMPGTCQTVTPPAAATFDVEKGNVQVRP